jgi:type II secretory pathway component GspD/PulD (secretin)
MTCGTRWSALSLLLASALLVPTPGAGRQAPRLSPDVPISVRFLDVPLPEVLLAFARYSGHSIVAGRGVEGSVTADIQDQPWILALETLAESQGFVLLHPAPGLLRVERAAEARLPPAILPLQTRVRAIHHFPAAEVGNSLHPLLTPRGEIRVLEGSNTMVITDEPDALERILRILPELDIPPRGVRISAQIVLLHRSRLEALGVRGGLEGADLRVALGPGGVMAHLLSGGSPGGLDFTLGLEALVAAQVAEVEARPHLTVLENETATLLVGERVPLPILPPLQDPTSAPPPGGWGGYPVSVQLEEVGIRLVVTPRVLEGNRVLLDLEAERSGVQWMEGGVGFLVNTQEASTRLIVRSGETAIIGGLTVREQVRSRSGVPLLARLPWLGALFRSTRVEDVERDLLILVTPELEVSPGEGRPAP